LLITFLPAGKMEAFFREVTKANAMPPQDPAVWQAHDWADQVEIQRLAASAWLAHAESEHESALKLMRAAAELEATTEKHPVTPGTVLPAREQLAEMLLEHGRREEALAEVKLVLREAPNRGNAMRLAAQARPNSR
jgi:hypothetical protein